MKQKHILQPKLRFPEFDGDWKKSKLNKFAEINPKVPSIPDVFIYIDLESVINGRLIAENIINKENAPSRAIRTLSKNDILFQTVRPYQKNNLLFNIDSNNYVASTGYAQIRTSNNSQFLYQYLHIDDFNKRVLLRCTGTSYPAINSGDLGEIDITFPSLPEQQKIADYLSTIDAKISLLEEKKTELSRYKKAMMQQLFSQQIRFKPVLSGVEGDEKGNDFPEWESFQLKDILFEHKEKNKSNKYTEVVSVAKEKGVINQIEHLGRSYSAENIEHYKVVNPFDVVYTKSPTSGFPFGIIKQNKLNRSAVLSPLYAVFKPKTIYLGMLLHDLFLSEVETFNYLVPLVQKGAKNTMNINNEDFLNGKKYKLPTSEKEQQKIADFLSAIDESIEKVNEQITQTQSFKKAMLQQMFV